MSVVRVCKYPTIIGLQDASHLHYIIRKIAKTEPIPNSAPLNDLWNKQKNIKKERQLFEIIPNIHWAKRAFTYDVFWKN